MSGLQNRSHYPVLIIGTGIAGLTTAFTLASAGMKVLLVTKAKDPADCNTSWAQGGIIYQGEDDSPAKLVSDIAQAGVIGTATRHVPENLPPVPDTPAAAVEAVDEKRA